MKRKDIFALMPSGGVRKLNTNDVFVKTIKGGYRKEKGKPILY